MATVGEAFKTAGGWAGKIGYKTARYGFGANAGLSPGKGIGTAAINIGNAGWDGGVLKYAGKAIGVGAALGVATAGFRLALENNVDPSEVRSFQQGTAYKSRSNDEIGGTEGLVQGLHRGRHG